MFLYDEHPQNIALSLELAKEFELDRDYALREMIRGVKPDIGVLRTYPEFKWESGSLEFSNGFSANEKNRLPIELAAFGLDQHEP